MQRARRSSSVLVSMTQADTGVEFTKSALPPFGFALRAGLWTSTLVLLICMAIGLGASVQTHAPLAAALVGIAWAATLVQVVLSPIAVLRLVRVPTSRNLLNYSLTSMGLLGAALFLRGYWLTLH
jgi:hypothetical protein